jgi:hypothetical protein
MHIPVYAKTGQMVHTRGYAYRSNYTLELLRSDAGPPVGVRQISLNTVAVSALLQYHYN